MDTSKLFQISEIWPKDMKIQDARKQWIDLEKNDLIEVLTYYHIEWQKYFNKKNSEPENPQIQAFRVKLYEQIETIKDLGLESLTYSIRQNNLLSQKSLEISNQKEEMIRSLESRLEAQTNALLTQQEISNILFDDVERLKNLNTVLTRERNDLIQLYERIQEDQRKLNEELLQYKTRDFRDRGNHLQQIQADIQIVIGSSERLIGKIDNLLIQSNKRNTSEELLQVRLQNLKKIFTYNNKLLLQLSQQLQNSEIQLIRIKLQNEKLQQEILQKTQEIEKIKTEFQAKSQEFMQQCKIQANDMQKLRPLDYDSHRTKSQRIQNYLNNLKNHFCEFGCNLFLRILNDCQKQIKTFNNQELETFLLNQIAELQKINNLDQQEKLLQGNFKILDKLNSETLVINRDILNEVKNMLQNIRILQEQVNYR